MTEILLVVTNIKAMTNLDGTYIDGLVQDYSILIVAILH